MATELLEDGVRGHGMNQADQRQDSLDLAALQVADEVPGEAVPPALPLLLEVLEPVLSDQLYPGFGQRAHVLGGDVLRRGEDLDVGSGPLADPLEVRADPIGVQFRDGLDHRYSIQTRPACRPVRSPSRRWE